MKGQKADKKYPKNCNKICNEPTVIKMSKSGQKIKCEKEGAKFLTNAQSNGLAQGASAGDQSLQLLRKKTHARTVMMANVDVNDNNNNGDNDNNNKDNNNSNKNNNYCARRRTQEQ